MGNLERTKKIATAFPGLTQTTFWQLNPSGSWDYGNDLSAATEQLLWKVQSSGKGKVWLDEETKSNTSSK